MVEIGHKFFMNRITVPLYPTDISGKSFTTLLLKAIESVSPSKQTEGTGLKDHPFDFNSPTVFKNHNAHHSTCIETKKESTVGLGFKTDKVEDTLDPLCEVSTMDVLGDVAEDYCQTGNGWMEIVRKDGDRITGLHHCSAVKTYVNVEDENHRKHYDVTALYTGGNLASAGTIKFAKFGDREDFLARMKGQVKKETVSELIHFRRPTSISRWYGMPDWLSAVPSIELVQCLHQYNYDFFLNRGVPEFMLFFLGQKLRTEDWEAIEEAMKANIGLTNSHKSLALNIQDREMKIQLERLAMAENKDSTYKDLADPLALEIVSAHRVPPLLAGIQIPGKLAATNELPNALKAFQKLVIGPNQKIFTTILNNTLGNPETNGGLGLKKGDFEFNTIDEDMSLEEMDVTSQMRQPIGEARAEGRKVEDGLKD